MRTNSAYILPPAPALLPGVTVLTISVLRPLVTIATMSTQIAFLTPQLRADGQEVCVFLLPTSPPGFGVHLWSAARPQYLHPLHRTLEYSGPTSRLP